MKALFYIVALCISMPTHSQSTIETTVRAGQVILGGLSILKSTKKTDKGSPLIASVCVRNQLAEKIIFVLEGEDTKGAKVIKEMVVQNDGKECVFNIPKGIYSYEVILSTKEVYKKGEYRFEEDVIITIKEE